MTTSPTQPNRWRKAREQAEGACDSQRPRCQPQRLIAREDPTAGHETKSSQSVALGLAAENLADATIRFVTTFNSGDDAAGIDNVLLQGDLAVSEVPLPAALPLYGTGLGLMGLFG